MYSVIYFILMIMIGWLLGRKRKSIGMDGAYSGIMVGMFINYALVPFMLHTFSSFYKSQNQWNYWYIQKLVFGADVTDWNILLSLLCTLIGLFGFCLGYKCKVRIRGSQKNNLDTEISRRNTLKKYDSAQSVKRIYSIAVLCLFLCTIMLVIYIKALGGVSSALSLSNSLRSHSVGMSDYGISSVYSYVFLLCGLIPLVFCFFLCVFSEKGNFKNVLLLIISALETILYLRLNSGKSGFIRFGIIIVYLICGKKLRKHFWWYVLAGGIICLPLLDVLDIWFSGGSIVQGLQNIDFRSNVIAFESPIELNYNLCQITSEYGYQYFKHYILDFLDVLPGLSFETSWECVSEFVRGIDWELKGGTPNDIITYGFLQFNVIGVFIHLFFVGQICAWIDKSLMHFKSDKIKTILSISFCANLISFVSCSDISSNFLHNLFFTGLLLFLLYVNKKRSLFYKELL